MHWVIMGPTGCGKSYYTAQMLDIMSKYKQIIIVDDSDYYHRQMKSDTTYAPISYKNYEHVDFDALIHWASKKHTTIVFEIIDLDDEETKEFLEDLGDYMTTNMLNSTLVIDEAYKFFPRWRYPKSISRMIRGGRKLGLDVIMVYQQFSDIDLAAPRQANFVVAFNTMEPREREKISKLLQVPIVMLSQLGQHDFVIKNLRTGEYAVGNSYKLKWKQIEHNALKI